MTGCSTIDSSLILRTSPLMVLTNRIQKKGNFFSRIKLKGRPNRSYTRQSFVCLSITLLRRSSFTVACTTLFSVLACFFLLLSRVRACVCVSLLTNKQQWPIIGSPTNGTSVRTANAGSPATRSASICTKAVTITRATCERNSTRCVRPVWRKRSKRRR